MDSLHIPAEHPKSLVVNFETNGKLFLSGVSCDEDPKPIYSKLYDWVKQFKDVAPDQIALVIRLKYFNTSSAKCLLELLNHLVELDKEKVSKVSITWCCEAVDEDMQDTIKIFEDLINHSIQMELVDAY